MWTTFWSSLMSHCISTEIMYKRYYYDFEKSVQIDIDKCEFEVKSTKYLEFILEVEKMYKWILKNEDHHELTSL
jgi:hypothetical protein